MKISIAEDRKCLRTRNAYHSLARVHENYIIVNFPHTCNKDKIPKFTGKLMKRGIRGEKREKKEKSYFQSVGVGGWG